ncbi:calcineurin-like phosphoesterase [Colletotrichum scovillei]|uniref:Calcineurin-like phosphoesterase n=1 Tax=Colletotrichum scovillei TaxID=1209932 RepID=A0A9P7R5N9_9PEZI|nr:calcineurin-like phosphoesterase [Colletotrichum scovillei]KAF4782433.1 calcineurin-like phosphoesterase [Colletotrichum scovillei]KAG7050680.1 calcineurin-like phosphoesterase [Colletotrichum scovillei]KAG7069726.1 calcineurin-like phosphoesterase [Colletotrichum scovillei]KAG7073672.1 calcineurin-like phosphoesterase [Colletotrichum scovillei]
MAIQIVSDIHLESPRAYDIFEIVPQAPYLGLLGDIGNVAAHQEECLAFLTQQLRQFRAVLFVPGNHEAYHSRWDSILGILQEFQAAAKKDSSLGDFVLLDRSMFQVPDSNIVILGCSLFSFIPPESADSVSMGLQDFFQIDDWEISSHNEAHKRDLSWLNSQVAELETSEARVIIFSHWSPTRDARASDPRHAQSPITSGFATDLSKEDCFKSARVKLWAFGHTHYNCDFSVEREGDTEPLRLIANQRGYYFAQAAGFDENKVIRI